MFLLDHWYRGRDLRIALANWILPANCIVVREDEIEVHRLSSREKVCYRETVRRLERALQKARSRLAVSSGKGQALIDALREVK